MTAHALLDSTTHRDLRVSTTRSAALGDAVMTALVVPDEFREAMDDDLNVPQGLAVLHETVRAVNGALATGDIDDAAAAVRAVTAMSEVLGLLQLMNLDGAGGGGEHQALDSMVRQLLDQRAQARADKNWALADKIRDQLADAGVVVKDGAQGSVWSV